MYVGWYGVCNVVVISAVEACVDYGGVYVFQVCFDVCVVYGVWFCVVKCCLFLSLSFTYSLVGVLGVVLSVMRVVGGVLLWVICVFLCRCCVLVSVVYPVAIMSAVFCVICSLLMFVYNSSGDRMVKTYSSMGLVMALYVASIVYFVFSMLLM